jgi:hypothetical protein
LWEHLHIGSVKKPWRWSNFRDASTFIFNSNLKFELLDQMVVENANEIDGIENENENEDDDYDNVDDDDDGISTLQKVMFGPNLLISCFIHPSEIINYIFFLQGIQE